MILPSATLEREVMRCLTDYRAFAAEFDVEPPVLCFCRLLANAGAGSPGCGNSPAGGAADAARGHARRTRSPRRGTGGSARRGAKACVRSGVERVRTMTGWLANGVQVPRLLIDRYRTECYITRYDGGRLRGSGCVRSRPSRSCVSPTGKGSRMRRCVMRSCGQDEVMSTLISVAASSSSASRGGDRAAPVDSVFSYCIDVGIARSSSTGSRRATGKTFGARN